MTRPLPATRPAESRREDPRTAAYWEKDQKRRREESIQRSFETRSGSMRWVLSTMKLKPYNCAACGSTPQKEDGSVG
jgi:hypothetical protein